MKTYRTMKTKYLKPQIVRKDIGSLLQPLCDSRQDSKLHLNFSTDDDEADEGGFSKGYAGNVEDE